MRETSSFLTDKQTAILAAAMNRIVPPDESPGAWEAGAGAYLLGQFSRDLADVVPLYRLGLDALDEEAQAEYRQGFSRLDAAAQDALLARVEEGKVTADWPVSPARFFRLLVQHTMEGYYADPGNGGNRGGAAWAMVGYEVRG